MDGADPWTVPARALCSARVLRVLCSGHALVPGMGQSVVMGRLWMTWSIDGVGSAGQNVADVEAACRALVGSVERSRRAFDVPEPWEELRESALILQDRILGSGREVLDQGRQWTSTLKGVSIILIPRD